MSGAWTAIVLAGQRPGENEFAEANGTKWKALIPVGGEAMLGRVVRVLLEAAPIGRIVILAQEPHSLMTGELAWMEAEPRIATALSGDGISRSIAAIAGSAAAPFPLLLATADHALLTGEMVDAFLDAAGETDAAVALVERGVVEAAYPETRRTWLRFSDGDYSGANLFALRTAKARKGLEMWAEVERDRKKALRLLMSFGPLLALRALTRTISLDRALAIAGRRAGFAVRAVRLAFAEAAIDVDKPSDLALAERILAARAGSAGVEEGDAG